MAFNIMDMFAAPAVNRLLQPLQNAGGVASFTPPAGNRLVDPGGLGGATPGLMPQGNDPWAGLRQPTVDPMTVAGTGNGGAAPVMGSMGVAQPDTSAQQPKQGFWDKTKGFLGSDRMQDVFTGWMMGGNDWQKSLAYGGLMSAQGRKSRNESNQTVDWLKRKGLDEETAKQVAANPATLQDYLKRLITPQDPKDALQLEKLRLEVEGMRNPQEKATDDIREYQYAKSQGFEGSFTDWQTKGVKDQDATFGREQGIRKEYTGTPEYKRFDDVRASYDRVRAAARRESGAGDLGLIFGFMKMLDPGSVVREGEFANAENTAGVPDRIRNLYNRVISGERLNDDQRKEFIATAGDLYNAESDRMKGLNERYSGIAGQYNLDPSRIIVQPPVYDPLNLGGEAGQAPAGVDPNIWRHMTPEERRLWQ